MLGFASALHSSTERLGLIALAAHPHGAECALIRTNASGASCQASEASTTAKRVLQGKAPLCVDEGTS